MLKATRNQRHDATQRQRQGIQPATTIATAETAIRQLTNNDDRMRTEGAPDELSGLIMERAFFERATSRWKSCATGWRQGYTSETIDKNRAMGRAQSSTSAWVRAQHVAADREPIPIAQVWFMSELLLREVRKSTEVRTIEGTHSGGTPITVQKPVAWAARKGWASSPLPRIKCTCRANSLARLQKNEKLRFWPKNAGLTFWRPVTPGANRPRRWSDSLQRLVGSDQGVGRFAPPLPPDGIPDDSGNCGIWVVAQVQADRP